VCPSALESLSQLARAVRLTPYRRMTWGKGNEFYITKRTIASFGSKVDLTLLKDCIYIPSQVSYALEYVVQGKDGFMGMTLCT
jgi:hypothetical protein